MTDFTKKIPSLVKLITFIVFSELFGVKNYLIRLVNEK